MTTNRSRLIKACAKNPGRASQSDDWDESMIGRPVVQKMSTKSACKSISESISTLFCALNLHSLNFVGEMTEIRPEQTGLPLIRSQFSGKIKIPHCLLTYSYLLLNVVVLFATGEQQVIPGCSELSTVAKAVNYNGSFCFCSTQDGSNISISCLYGSTLQQFKEAFNAVNAAHKIVDQVRFHQFVRCDMTTTLKSKLNLFLLFLPEVAVIEYQVVIMSVAGRPLSSKVTGSSFLHPGLFGQTSNARACL